MLQSPIKVLHHPDVTEASGLTLYTCPYVPLPTTSTSSKIPAGSFERERRKRGLNTQGHWCFLSCCATSAKRFHETKGSIEKQHFICLSFFFFCRFGVEIKKTTLKSTPYLFLFSSGWWCFVLFWILHIHTSMPTLSGGHISCCYTHVSSVKSGPWLLKSYWTAPVLVIAATWLP